MTAFLLSARFTGVNAALTAIFPTKYLIQMYRDRIFTDGDSSWWDAGKAWDGLGAALEAIGYKVA